MIRTRTPAIGVAAATALAAASVLLGPGAAANAESAPRRSCTEINFAYRHTNGGTLVTTHCAAGAWVSVDSRWGPGTGGNPCVRFAPSTGNYDADSVFFTRAGTPFICR